MRLGASSPEFGVALGLALDGINLLHSVAFGIPIRGRRTGVGWVGPPTLDSRLTQWFPAAYQVI